MTRGELKELLDELVHEAEAARFHDCADELDADEEDCCDGDADGHALRCEEIQEQILDAYDALRSEAWKLNQALDRAVGKEGP